MISNAMKTANAAPNARSRNLGCMMEINKKLIDERTNT